MSVQTDAVDLLSTAHLVGCSDALRARYVTALHRDDAALSKQGPADHLTASCMVFSADLSQVLLVFHRKGKFWVQPGGHIEACDSTIQAAVRREVLEETGVDVGASFVTCQGSYIVNLNHHQLPGTFGMCRSHLDVPLVAIADLNSALVLSHESEDISWWPLAQLPDQIVPDLPGRLTTIRRWLHDNDWRSG